MQRREACHVPMTEKALCGQSPALGWGAVEVSGSCSGGSRNRMKGEGKRSQGQDKRLGPGGEKPCFAVVETF